MHLKYGRIEDASVQKTPTTVLLSRENRWSIAFIFNPALGSDKNTSCPRSSTLRSLFHFHLYLYTISSGSKSEKRSMEDRVLGVNVLLKKGSAPYKQVCSESCQTFRFDNRNKDDGDQKIKYKIKIKRAWWRIE